VVVAAPVLVRADRAELFADLDLKTRALARVFVCRPDFAKVLDGF
jgi:hypothetical protein